MDGVMEISRSRRSSIKGMCPAPILITGGDALRREEAVRVLEEALCPDEALRQWCLVKVDAEESSGDQRCLDLVSTPPVLGERRVVVVKGAGPAFGDEALLAHVAILPGFPRWCWSRRLRPPAQAVQEIQRRGRVLAYEAPAGGGTGCSGWRRWRGDSGFPWTGPRSPPC